MIPADFSVSHVKIRALSSSNGPGSSEQEFETLPPTALLLISHFTKDQRLSRELSSIDFSLRLMSSYFWCVV